MSRDLRLFRMAMPPLSEPAAHVTSWPYPYYHVEAAETSIAFVGGYMLEKVQDDLQTSIGFVSAELRSIFREYSDWPSEKLETSIGFVSGSVDSIFVSYSDWPAENLETSIGFVSGSADRVRIEYTDWPVENLETSIGFVSGDMS